MYRLVQEFRRLWFLVVLLLVFGQHAEEKQHRKQYAAYDKDIQITFPAHIHIEKLVQRKEKQTYSAAHDQSHHVCRDKGSYGVGSEVPARNVILFFDEREEKDGKPQCQDGRPVGYAYFGERPFRREAVEVYGIGNEQYVHHDVYTDSFYPALNLFAPQVEGE